MEYPRWFGGPEWRQLLPSLLSICASASRVIRRPITDEHGTAIGMEPIITLDMAARGAATRLLASEVLERIEATQYSSSDHIASRVVAGEGYGGEILAIWLSLSIPQSATDLFPHDGWASRSSGRGAIDERPSREDQYRVSSGIIAAGLALLTSVEKTHTASLAIDTPLAHQAKNTRIEARDSFVSRLNARYPGAFA